MKCKYCNRGIMHLVGDECVDVYVCVGCNTIAIKDIELNRDEYTWYREEPLREEPLPSLLAEVRAMLDTAMQLLTTREFREEDGWIDDYEDLWEKYDNSFPKD